MSNSSRKGGRAAQREGEKVEERMIKLFKGKPSGIDDFDIETSKCLYEVKSCNLFNSCVRYQGGYKKLKQEGKPFKKYTHLPELGRFKIRPENHVGLFLHAQKLNKIPKYVFAVRHGNQIIWKVLGWNEVKVPKQKSIYCIKLKDIFYDASPEIV